MYHYLLPFLLPYLLLYPFLTIFPITVVNDRANLMQISIVFLFRFMTGPRIFAMALACVLWWRICRRVH